MSTSVITVSLEDYLWFVDQALDGMISIVTELGDAQVNARPDLPGANSADVILTHCLGVMELAQHHGQMQVSRDTLAR